MYKRQENISLMMKWLEIDFPKTLKAERVESITEHLQENL